MKREHRFVRERTEREAQLYPERDWAFRPGPNERKGDWKKQHNVKPGRRAGA